MSYEKDKNKAVTITLDEFMTAQVGVMVEFQKYASEKGDLETVLPVLMIMPALFARLAHKIFDDTDEEQEMDEAHDADRKTAPSD